jgi:hypothetical protein
MYYICFTLTVIGLSIASITGLVSFKKIDKRYQPFIYYIFYRFCRELFEHYLAVSIRNNIIVYNVNVIIETLIFLYQFWIWDIFSRRKNLYLGLIFILLGVWMIEMYRNNNFTTYPNLNFLSVSSALYSFFIVIFGIQTISTVIFKINKSLFQNAQFLIVIGLTISYLFNALTFIFNNYNLNFSNNFYSSIQQIGMIIITMTNFLYAYAITRIPKNPSFLTLPG